MDRGGRGFRGSRGGSRGGGRGRGRGAGSSSGNRVTTKLFVGNLPDTVRKSELQDLFEQYGKVVECDIVKDYAFVHFASATEADEAVKNLHESDFQGYNIRVECSHSHVRTKPGMGNKNECFRCGSTDHWSKDCPQAPPGRREREREDRFRDRLDRRDPYPPRRPDPYARSLERDPYARSSLVRDPYERDPYDRDALLARARLADRYRALRYDPYERRLAAVAAVREARAARERDAYAADPYARPPPEFYSRLTDPLERRDPLYDELLRARLAPRLPLPP